ncbi:MAG TPA: helix-turn-helix domain-containing protein [Jatrophihabitans sp.]|jgi:DNA-binding HxlR family transcriptional regulator|nr:helix-turn-helix domain-containing protein [Jatrophihabitans sp.]
MPNPGDPVRGSRSGRPIMVALDLLGRRWALRIMWELRDGPLGARELRRRCDDISPSVLYARLTELRSAALIDQDANGDYGLTRIGARLGTAIEPLDRWAREWARATS